MIVVPALSHADKARELDVVTLNAGAVDYPRLATLTVRIVPNKPMARNADSNPRTDAPNNPRHASKDKEGDRPRKLLGHPRPFEPAVYTIMV